MIIDSHTHVDEVEAWGWIDPPEVLLPLLDEAGIDQASGAGLGVLCVPSPAGGEITASV